MVSIGDKVTWTETRTTSGGFSMRRMDGAVEIINDGMAKVKLGNNRRTWVNIALLHSPDEPTDITKMLDRMRERNK